jgi:hypothetical protein
MNKNKFLVTTTITALSLFTCGTMTAVTSPSLSQTVSSGCYMVNEYGEMIDLSPICSPKSPSNIPTAKAESSDKPDATTPSTEKSEPSEKSDSSPENSTGAGEEKPTASEGEDKAPEEQEDKTATPTAEEEKEKEIDRAKLPNVQRAIPLIQRQRQDIKEEAENQ